MFRARAEAAGIELAHVSVGEVTSSGNRAALGTAVSALVANALRYTPRGGRVELTVARADQEVLVHVDDSGPGVPSTERAEIFAPLRRGEAGRRADSASPDQVGLGLGLAIVRRVADQHGGSVEVGESTLGGARFTLRLPFFIQSSS